MSRRKKSATNPRTVVALIQDKSGSMGVRRTATISGYNEYVDKLKEEPDSDKVLLTLTQFDTDVVNVFTSKKLKEVEHLSNSTYVPGGMTALYAAVGRTVRAMENTVRKDDKVLVVIMTDGGENSSHYVDPRWHHQAILDLFEEKRGAGWEFIFLGAGEEAWNVGASLGFDHAHSINYSGIDAHDHQAGYGELVASTSSVLRGASAQAASSYLSSSPVKAALENKAQGEVQGANLGHGDLLWVPDGRPKPRNRAPRHRSQ